MKIIIALREINEDRGAKKFLWEDGELEEYFGKRILIVGEAIGER